MENPVNPGGDLHERLRQLKEEKSRLEEELDDLYRKRTRRMWKFLLFIGIAEVGYHSLVLLFSRNTGHLVFFFFYFWCVWCLISLIMTILKRPRP